MPQTNHDKVFLKLMLLAYAVLQVAQLTAQPLEEHAAYPIFEKYLEIPTFITGGDIEPQWYPDGRTMWYAKAVADGHRFYKIDPSTLSITEVFDYARLSSLLGEYQDGDHGLPFSTFQFDDDEASRVRFEVDTVEFLLDLQSYTLERQVSDQVQDPLTIAQDLGAGPYGFTMREMISPDGKYFAQRRDHDIWLRTAGDTTLKRITHNGERLFAWGEYFEWAEDWTRPWIWWSADSRYLAVKRTDRRSVTEFAIPGITFKRDSIEWISRAQFGSPLPRRELFIFDLHTGKRVPCDIGSDPEAHIYVLGWRGLKLWYLTLDPERQHLVLRVADKSANSRIIMAEHTTSAHPPLWSRLPILHHLGTSNYFLWSSERDDWKHLYFCHQDSGMLHQVTSGAFPVEYLLRIDSAVGKLYFTARSDPDRPYDVHFHRVGLDGNDLERLTHEPGQHAIKIAPCGEYFIDTYSSVDRPPVVRMKDMNGQLLLTLDSANIDKLIDLGWQMPQEVAVLASDGKTDLHGVLYKPYDFDSTRQYPLIEYIYDARWTTVVSRTFSPRRGYSASGHFPADHADPRALAQLGFVVWVVDGRGSARRGRVFRETFNRSDSTSIVDHVAALHQLGKRYPFIDLDRVGVFGISAGGGQTLVALLAAPELYKAGVAIAAGTTTPDMSRYDILGNAQSLQGKLMLMSGLDDRSVLLSHQYRLIEKLTAHQKDYDLVLLPGQGHSIEGVSARYARRVTANFFLEHLHGGEVGLRE